LDKGDNDWAQLGEWPLRQDDGRLVMLVVQQWTREPAGNGWLGPGLEQDEQCQGLVVELKAAQLWVKLQRLAGGFEEAASICVELEHLMGVSEGAGGGDDRLDVLRAVWLKHAALGDDYALGRLLHQRRVPDTPSFRAYVRALVAEGPLPDELKRESRVTYRVFGEEASPLRGCPMRWTWNKKSRRSSVITEDLPEPAAWLLRARGLRFHDGSPRFAIEGDVTNGGLLRAASSTALRLQKWLDRCLMHPRRPYSAPRRRRCPACH
jgi:hypothetical protein